VRSYALSELKRFRTSLFIKWTVWNQILILGNYFATVKKVCYSINVWRRMQSRRTIFIIL